MKRIKTNKRPRWEYLDSNKVPRWVKRSSVPGVHLDYFQSIELKGRHYKYRASFTPRYQGDKGNKESITYERIETKRR